MALLLAALVPGVLLMMRPRVAIPMVVTIAATWFVATMTVFVALHVLSDLGLFILVWIIVVPVVTVATAISIGVKFAPKPSKVFDAGFLAMCGWWIGFVVMLFSNFDLGGFWDCAMFVAFPSIFAGAGAAFGATNPRTA
jgi:hypothetical protein